MALIFHVNPSGARRSGRIRAAIERQPNIHDKLRQLPQGGQIELTYDPLGRFRPIRGFDYTLPPATESELQRLGVVSIAREGAGNEVRIAHGPSATLDRMEELMARVRQMPPGQQQHRALLHVVQTLHFPGVPQENIDSLVANTNMDITTVATGQASARGIAATGNLGAISLLQIFGRIYEAAISVLNGGHGTRLFGLRKLKGDITYGRNNLTIWNLFTALYFKEQMPQNTGFGEYHVTLANDGILIPCGKLTAAGEALVDTPPERAKEAYIFVSPDNPQTMSEKETKRFGMVAMRSNGEFICATEKEGREATITAALNRLAAQGENAEPEEIRLYLNLFGMASTAEFEADLKQALEASVKPGLTADSIADLDTYSLLFAALSSDSPSDFRANITKQGFNRLFVEGNIDKVLFPRLRKALFKNGKPRIGFAEFNRGDIAIDIGTLESLYKYYHDMVANYDRSGAIRDQFLGYLRTLETYGQLTNRQEAEVCDLEETLKNNTRVRRHTAQRIAGFDPNLILETVELPIIPEGHEDMAPILGVASDAYAMPHELSQIGSKSAERSLSNIIANGAYKSPEQSSPLVRLEDEHGRLRAFYDPEGISSLKLAHVRIRMGAVVGRNAVAINSEIGNGTDRVVIPDNGAIINSQVTASISHEQTKVPDRNELTKQLSAIATKGEGTYTLPIQDGWRVVFYYQGTQQSQQVAEGVVNALNSQSGPARDARKAPESIHRLRSLLGMQDRHDRLTLDMTHGTGRLVLANAEDDSSSAVSGSDPSHVHHFSVFVEKDKRPSYILYGRRQRDPLTVKADTVFASRQPTANAPAMDYEAGFDADPKTTRLTGLFEGMVMKDPRMQTLFGYYTRFKVREFSELAPMAAEMAGAVGTIFDQLPVVAGMPEGIARVPVTLFDQNAMQAVITQAANAGKSLTAAIITEIRRQTPDILGGYIAQALGRNPQTVASVIRDDFQAQATRRQRFILNDLYESLGIAGNLAASRDVENIIKGYPLSQYIFHDSECGATIASFRPVVEALVSRFRITEMPVMEPLDQDLTVDHELSSEHRPIFPNPADDFDLG